MKSLITILIVLLTSQFASASFIQPEIFNAAPQNVYAPMGFDSNDNVRFLFEGQFTDACYQTGMTFTDVDEEKKEIYVTDTGHYFPNDFCAEVMVPYQKEIQAGVLKEGKYDIYFRNSRGNFVQAGVIPVLPAATTNLDNHIYAPVKKSRFYRSTPENPPYILLSGQFTNGCMKLDKVRVSYRPKSNVVDILPIAKIIDENCEDTATGIDFEHKVNLAQLNPGRFLVHIRSLNGQAVNEIIEIE